MTQRIGTLTAEITTDTTGLVKGVKKTDRALATNEKRLKKNSKQWEKWSVASVAATAAVTLGLGMATRQVAQYADAFTSIQNNIRQTTNSTEELTERTEQLLNVSIRSRAEFGATAELYSQLVLSTENLNISTEEQLRLTETITKSFSIQGKTAAESAGAIRQLGQAFSAGALRGDEFNSIAEGAPEIMRALQRSLKMTQGELREFAAEGGITSEILVTALGGAADVIDLKMAKSVKTLAQSLQEAESKAIAFVGTSRGIKSAMTTTGETVIFLAENLDVLANIALAGVTVAFAKGTSAAILNTVETLKNTAAKLASVPVTKVVNNGINFTTRSVVAQTTAMRVATMAATGMKGALAFLGGPLGVAILAATAITTFALSAETAEEKSRKLSERVDQLSGSFSNLTKQQIEVKLANATTEANNLEKQLLLADQKLKKLEEFSGVQMRGAVDAQKRAVEELNIQLADAVLKRDALFNAGLNVGRTPEEGTGSRDGEQKIIDEAEELKRQKAADAFALRFQKIQDDLAKERELKQQAAADEFADLEQRRATETELENIFHEEDLERLRQVIADKGATEAEGRALEKQLVEDHEKALTEIKAREERARLMITASGFEAAAQALSIGGKKVQKIAKKLAIIGAVIKGKQAAVDAWQAGMSTGGPYAPLVAAAYTAASIARTAGMISSIRSGGSSSGASGGGGGSLPSVSGVGQPVGGAAQGPTSPRNIDINLIGGGGLLSTDQMRELIEQINVQVGDGVELNVTGG